MTNLNLHNLSPSPFVTFSVNTEDILTFLFSGLLIFKISFHEYALFFLSLKSIFRLMAGLYRSVPRCFFFCNLMFSLQNDLGSVSPRFVVTQKLFPCPAARWLMCVKEGALKRDPQVKGTVKIKSIVN